jgi:hypothetical protein
VGTLSIFERYLNGDWMKLDSLFLPKGVAHIKLSLALHKECEGCNKVKGIVVREERQKREDQEERKTPISLDPVNSPAAQHRA